MRSLDLNVEGLELKQFKVRSRYEELIVDARAHLGEIPTEDTSLDPVDHQQDLGSNRGLLRPVDTAMCLGINCRSPR
jgi:hypothetical protein